MEFSHEKKFWYEIPKIFNGYKTDLRICWKVLTTPYIP